MTKHEGNPNEQTRSTPKVATKGLKPANSSLGLHSSFAIRHSSFSELEQFQAGRLRWLVRPSASSEKLCELLNQPDAFLAKGSLLADSDLITMARIAPLEPGGPTLVLRRLNYGRWRHRLRDIFRLTRAERAFRNGLKLERAGVRTARAVAVGVERLARWPRRAYLLTEWVPEALALKDWIEREGSLPRAQIYQLAELLAGLHNSGFSHRDLKSSNVLFDERRQPYLIDLDGVRDYQDLSESRAMADLSRFAWEFVSYTRFLKWNARRFLRRYCRLRGIESDLPRLEKEIAKPLMRRLAAGIRRWK